MAGAGLLFLHLTDTDKKEITNFLDMKFVYISPGTFIMGSPENESGRRDDETQHQVTLTKGFYMQKTEVTQGQWKALIGSNPSKFKGCGEDCPVETITWNDAQHFIDKLNQKESGRRYRLPTGAQWEYAARTGTQAPYYTGDTEADLDRAGWYIINAYKAPHPVARKEPNSWGLYDTHGNVWEWCQDWYGQYTKESAMDPSGPPSGSFRVLRGGSWSDPAWNCRAALRCRAGPDGRGHYLGFRLVLLTGQ